MSTLWTPEGEIHVDRRPTADLADDESRLGADTSALSAEELAELDLDELSPEEREAAEEYIREIAQANERIRETPAAVMIANHAMGLYQLAALHLTSQPPNFSEASLAIDALGGLMEGAKGRLGSVEPEVRDALEQIRMAFVQLKNRPAPSDAEDAEPSD